MTYSPRYESEAVFTSNCKAPVRVDFKNFFEQKSPTLDVEKKSIESLKAYGKQRYLDALKERDPQYQICMMHWWDGYITAITEILEMEGQ